MARWVIQDAKEFGVVYGNKPTLRECIGVMHKVFIDRTGRMSLYRRKRRIKAGRWQVTVGDCDCTVCAPRSNDEFSCIVVKVK